MSRRIITFLSVGLALVVCVIYPAATYNLGTSRNVTVEVLAEPFGDGPELVYRWEGNVYRSCPVEIRRKFVDSAGVVTFLVSRTPPRLPSAMLGLHRYEISVPVPRQIAPGPAVYQATEVPICNIFQWLFPKEFPYPPVNFTVTR